VKQNKGISLIVIIIIIAVIIVGAIVCVFAVKDGKNKQEIDKNNNTDISTENTNTLIENNENIEESTKKVFWINSKKGSQQKEKFGFTLYNDKISLPIKLENLDVCSAPYSFFPNEINQTNADAIQEILKSTIKIKAGNETKISTQKKFVDGSWKNYDEQPDNIENIIIKNYNDADATIAECYNNGWWYIQNQYSLDDVLGLDMTKNVEYRENWDESPLLDIIVEKNGFPTYVRMSSAYSENLKSNEGGILYELIYKYDEYVIVFAVSEMIMSEYDSYMITVGGPIYYTKESWEKEQSKITVKEQIKNNGINFEIVKK